MMQLQSRIRAKNEKKKFQLMVLLLLLRRFSLLYTLHISSDYNMTQWIRSIPSQESRMIPNENSTFLTGNFPVWEKNPLDTVSFAFKKCQKSWGILLYVGFKTLFNSKTTYSTIDARYSMTWKKLFTLNSAWAAFDAYLHHSIFFTDANLHHFAWF